LQCKEHCFVTNYKLISHHWMTTTHFMITQKKTLNIQLIG
jgi:hypothetical protein